MTLQIIRFWSGLKSKSLLGILVIAFLLRIILFVGILVQNSDDGFLSYDSYGYLNLSHNIINHHVFSRASEGILYPDIYRTPVYPLFLSIFRVINLSILIQIIISVVSCYVLYLIAISVNLNKKYATFACLILAIDLPSIVYANLLMSETLFVFLLLTSLYLLFLFVEKSKLYLMGACGLILGLAILCRPIAQFLPPLYLFFIIWKTPKRSIFKSLAIFSISLTIAVAPWLVRNYTQFGALVVSTSGSINFCSWQVANINSKKNNQNIGVARGEFWKKIYLKSGIKNRTPYDVGVLDLAMNEAKKTILTEKKLAFQQHIRAILNILLKPVRRDLELQLGMKKGLFEQRHTSDIKHARGILNNSSTLIKGLVCYQIITLTTIYLSIFYNLFYFKSNTLFKGSKILLIFIIGYFLNLNTPPVSNSRLRLPLYPCLIIISLSMNYTVNKTLKRNTKYWKL